jgi:hypothetical protein
MGLLRRNETDNIEKLLDQQRTRKKMLLAQKAAAESALQRALANRRQTMIEADMDNGRTQEARALTVRLRDENDSIDDALSSLDAQISEIEARLVAERAARARELEAARLREEMAKVREKLTAMKTACAEATDAMRALDKIPAMLAARENLERVAPQLVVGTELGLADGESYIAQMLAEHTPILAELPAAPEPPPPAAIERKQIFLRHPGKWVENGEIVTAGKHVVCMPPLAVALAAIQHGHAVDPESRVAQELRRLQDPDYAFQPAASCFDISRPMPEPKPAEPRATEPIVHSGLPGARVGVATAVPTR